MCRHLNERVGRALATAVIVVVALLFALQSPAHAQGADQAGTVALSATTPQVDEAITATLTDPDGGVTGTTWQWSSSNTSGGTYTNISEATSASYTPVATDSGKYLKATASYTDAHGPGKSAEKVADNAVVTVVNICDRTPEVEAVILAQVTGATCSTITDAQLAAIVRSLLIEGYSSPTLLSSDFAGLTGVNVLTISASPDLQTVPANAFSEIPNLTDLYLTDNAIDTLHPNAFGDLSELEALDLTYNHIKILEEGVFNGLSSLTRLILQKNALAEVHPGVFDALTSLTYLALQSNNIADLDAGTFNMLTGLTSLILSENELSSVHADLFDGLTSLQYLYLSNNELSSVDADLFDGLTSLL